MPNGRCKFHGGMSTGRPITHGKYSKFMPKNLAEKIAAARADDDIRKLTDDLLLITALQMECSEHILSDGEHAELWTNAYAIFESVKRSIINGDAASLKLNLANLESVFNNGIKAEKAESKFLDLARRKAEIIKQDVDREVKLDAMMSSRQAKLFMMTLLEAVLEEVKDPGAVRRIEQDVVRRLGSGLLPQVAG